ncbi:hypothetical protein H721_03218 [Brucella ovis IntaBari-2006-46-332]|nr:hypothetical protein C010_02203 [Brucella ovis 80/125]ENR05254.1 hypothetical protein C961_03080 [Brucella ovis F8/05B]ENS93861.1 hypothetical protein B999_02182 [Brucella ovis 63/96]ENS95457.1 hypothetical protein C009_03236 [Brucella ovis 81/8]ENT76260.1 hypothetical protein H720_03152 [Brucella ovis IntaBari-2006-46-348]ENT76478.1 hypothetical protein H712_02182 [Brucella ovis IntaBari-2009-88-4]ENT82244.1 hypothetical protein H713_02187 [Brucella ovis IntaBari-2010-47-268]ENT84607.1 h
MTTFSVKALQVDRASIPVIRGVDVEVRSGEISVLLGSNGAGKTTFLESLSGIIPARAGTIRLDETELARLRPGARTKARLSHVEQRAARFSRT